MSSSRPELQVVILAAGQGKRMRSDLPKVLHPLAGKPLLAHVLDTASTLAPSRTCIVIGHGAERVKEAFAARPIAWAVQQQQLGTGHAVMQALPHTPGAGVMLVLYGDVPLISAQTLAELVAAAQGGALALLTQNLDEPRGYGRIVRDAAGRVARIVEEKDASEEERRIREVNTGILAAPRARLEGWLAGLRNDNAQGEYYLTDVVAAAVADGTAIEVRHPGAAHECLGVNSKGELASLERRIQMNQANNLLERGVTLADPARIDVRGELACGRDVAIDVNCIFEGRVELGDGVRVGAGCILRDVVVGAGTEIKPYSILEETTVGSDARIGPYARTRPGTRLSDAVHIGNFVEVKASAFGARSKANHLAYIGDSSVGTDVNIGAGTITCNYDGAAKHRTVIEDDVHIGSDVQLIAPVTVGRGATIGAGATITDDVPPGGLTLTQKKQVSKPDWKRPRKK
ncbi:MAG TPA: bifunctional UDP-N-acetylglucosamine diphosphorylase/glucosamine-1-phosphate N-acetyltransferase GlmU [Usitatibacter sp.]|jgi:bifunctional UDP-N-acetylglucosamine pyrophosphorylase/glucosamine-1-phosphate N-acetyltransferase|nr:bifunctional UDP-N-acetylglucosamine diphosphorylase/glucosamine-1-phosphate N-acetyltransferase GlmU [Usitatibacter sp.]